MYDINYHNNNLGIFTQCVVIVMISIGFLMGYSAFKESELIKMSPYIFIILIITGGLFILISLIKMLKLIKKRSIMKQLNEYGKLVKNLPYTLKGTTQIGTSEGTQLYCMVAEYQLPDGNIVKFVSDPQYDIQTDFSDRLVDVVYDENDPKKYFVDFEINRLSGNLPNDYYQLPPELQQQDDNYNQIQ